MPRLLAHNETDFSTHFGNLWLPSSVIDNRRLLKRLEKLVSLWASVSEQLKYGEVMVRAIAKPSF